MSLAIMLALRTTCSRRAIRQHCRSYMLVEGIEKAVSKRAANEFLKSMEEDSRIIDTPTLSTSDTKNKHLWRWDFGLDSSPQMSLDDLKNLHKDAKDAFMLVQKDISSLSGGIKELIGSDHPVLESCAKYFFDIDGGKKIRPTMVLAISYALNSQKLLKQSTSQVNGVRELDSSCIRTDSRESTNKQSTYTIDDDVELFATPSQKRLAEITEMIHTASLFHDDVIDKATTRRNQPSINQVFGNKLAILGGDFLLSRASVSLARLRNLEVVELLSTVIEHLVKGEIMQMKPSSVNGNRTAMEYYLRKNYYKTASLMGHSCLAAAVLGGHNIDCQRASYLYGTYIGQAFQLIDDALDFEGTVVSLGKAPLADLKSGLATAPTLFAAEEHPKLMTMIDRKFELPGDVDEALGLVMKSKGIERCKQLAQVHAERAIAAIQVLAPSEARDALISLACKVVTRSH